MRLLAITPICVDAEELARRQARYDRLAPVGVRVHLENLGSDSQAPRALETAADVEASEVVLLERYAASDVAGYDAFLPDCVLDPLVGRGLELGAPVLGIGRLTAQYLLALDATLGAVARNEAIASELDRKLASYGTPLSLDTLVLDLSVDDIADDATWTGAVGRATSRLDCDYVFNACSAVEVGAGGRRPLVVDPTAVALRLLGVQHSMTSVPT